MLTPLRPTLLNHGVDQKIPENLLYQGACDAQITVKMLTDDPIAKNPDPKRQSNFSLKSYF